MILPENKRVQRDGTKSIKIWIYGTPNIGKTTFANQFPDPLMINTDGNYKYVDAPVVTLVGDDTKDPEEPADDEPEDDPEDDSEAKTKEEAAQMWSGFFNALKNM